MPDDNQTDKQGRKRMRRRQLIINPTFQWRYAMIIMFGVFVATAFMSLMLQGAMLRMARARVLYPETPGSWEYTFIILVSSLAFSVVATGAFGLFAIIFTHRMCGPVAVVTGWLQELAAGRMPKLRPLRRKDEFQDLHASLSQVVATFRQSRQQEQATVTQALTMVETALSAEDGQRREALESAASELQSLRNMVEQALDAGMTETPPHRPADSQER